MIGSTIQIIINIIRGFIFWTFVIGGCAMIKDLARDAADAHKVGLTSYSKYTKALTK